MEKNRICKICNRRFANGKAMGGHMRSHFSKLPLPPKPILQVEYTSPIKSPSSSSSLNYPSSENPMQSYRSVNHELPFMSSKSNLAASAAAITNTNNDDDDGESETDSPTRKRSKRRRKSLEKVAESSPEQVSSISDIFYEEDVALCLLMLSKDKRTRIHDEYIEEAEAEIEADDEDEDEDESFGVISVRSKGKYKCKTCNKGFRSYQALGGHKASHKKIKNSHLKEEEYEFEEGSGSGGGGNCIAVVVDHKTFKCPFCDKVFDSGQALGGHKKVHFSYLGNANKMSAKSSDTLLDLNLPAHEDDGEVSQTEVSTISNTKPYHLRY